MERAQAKKTRDVETDWARLWFGRKWIIIRNSMLRRSGRYDNDGTEVHLETFHVSADLYLQCTVFV